MHYSKRRILVGEIPVEVEVKPIIVGVEPDRPLCSQLTPPKKEPPAT